jgi:hypothetical protein
MKRDDDKSPPERRAFLEQLGRFAVVTPPVVSLMLAVADKASAEDLATSPGKEVTETNTTSVTKTNTTAVTKTNSTAVTKTNTTAVTKTNTTAVTKTTSVVTTLTTTTAVTKTETETTTVTNTFNPVSLTQPPESGRDALAMIIDSMGLMKIG